MAKCLGGLGNRRMLLLGVASFTVASVISSKDLTVVFVVGSIV